MDAEVEQADIIKEKIGLCIMDTDQALESPKVTDTSHADADADGHTTPPTNLYTLWRDTPMPPPLNTAVSSQYIAWTLRHTPNFFSQG